VFSSSIGGGISWNNRRDMIVIFRARSTPAANGAYYFTTKKSCSICCKDAILFSNSCLAQVISLEKLTMSAIHDLAS
jgi:hypothetical protein